MGPTGAIVTKSRCAAGPGDYDGIPTAPISSMLFLWLFNAKTLMFQSQRHNAGFGVDFE
jgi:hypothetical protein